jgi:hypothetical protein
MSAEMDVAIETVSRCRLGAKRTALQQMATCSPLPGGRRPPGFFWDGALGEPFDSLGEAPR